MISKVLLIALLSVCTKLFMIISLAANSKMSYIVLFRSAFSKSNSFLHKPKFFGQNLMISNFREGNRMANKILVNHSFCSFNQNIWMNLNYTFLLPNTNYFHFLLLMSVVNIIWRGYHWKYFTIKKYFTNHLLLKYFAALPDFNEFNLGRNFLGRFQALAAKY